MSRIKVSLPKTFVFDTIIEVQIGDINYGGHMSNDAFLRLAHEARIQFLQKYNWTELDLDGLGLIMTDAAIQFQGEVFHRQKLKIEIAVDDVSTLGFDLLYRFSQVDNDKPAAFVKTGMCFFDYNKKTIAKVSYATVDKLLALCID